MTAKPSDPTDPLGRLEKNPEHTTRSLGKLIPGGKRLDDGIPGSSSGSSRDRCHNLILQVIENADWCASLCKLPGDDAQQMVDFLNVVLHQAHISTVNEWKRVLNLSCKLAKFAQVYPRCYELHGIQYSHEPISEGGFANVHKGTYRNQVLCLKIVRQVSAKIVRMHINELALWAHLSHPNILPFFGVFSVGGARNICLVSPWMGNGDLRDYLSRTPQCLRMYLISDVVDGLTYLHGLDIVHGDLKGRNVLVPDSGRALIMDFGLSYMNMTITKSISASSAGGTVHWMAPELADGYDILDWPTKACDIWSFGCLCYEVLSRRIPFHQYGRDVQVIAALQRKELPGRKEPGDSGSEEIGDEMWNLMMKCWSDVPQDRPTCEEIQGWFQARPMVQGTRVEPERARDNTAFWEAVKAESDIEIDFERVHEILQRVRATTLTKHDSTTISSPHLQP